MDFPERFYQKSFFSYTFSFFKSEKTRGKTRKLSN